MTRYDAVNYISHGVSKDDNDEEEVYGEDELEVTADENSKARKRR